MTLKVIGAGLGRTGTLSLKLALERLLGEPCYHMMEVGGAAGHVEAWHQAALGNPPDWDWLFDGFGAAVDWPMAPFWEPLAEIYPDAIILLSTRSDSNTWFRSASSTIFDSTRRQTDDARRAMWQALSGLTFDGSYQDEAVAIDGYDRHNAHVLATAPSERLVSYQPGDGWEGLCTALGVDVPDEPFPHTNTTGQFRRRLGLEAP